MKSFRNRISVTRNNYVFLLKYNNRGVGMLSSTYLLSAYSVLKDRSQQTLLYFDHPSKDRTKTNLGKHCSTLVAHPRQTLAKVDLVTHSETNLVITWITLVTHLKADLSKCERLVKWLVRRSIRRRLFDPSRRPTAIESTAHRVPQGAVSRLAGKSVKSESLFCSTQSGRSHLLFLINPKKSGVNLYTIFPEP